MLHAIAIDCGCDAFSDPAACTDTRVFCGNDKCMKDLENAALCTIATPFSNMTWQLAIDCERNSALFLDF